MTSRLIPACALAAAVLASGCTARESAQPGPSQAISSAATTTVTFTVSTGDTAAAASVLRSRLDALGLRPGEAQVEGRRVTFGVRRVPAKEERDLLARPGHLTFRPVLRTFAPAFPAPGTSGDGDCAKPSYRLELGETYGRPEHNAGSAIACDSTGEAKYVLGPAEATGSDVKTARAEASTQGVGSAQWIVMLEMTSAADWAALTEKYVGQQVAIDLDGVVWSAPTVNERIPDGSAQISGSFTESSAMTLAAVLRGGPLPVGAVVVANAS